MPLPIAGRGPVKALRNVSTHIEKGEALVIIGPSGSNKSTLLQALNKGAVGDLYGLRLGA